MKRFNAVRYLLIGSLLWLSGGSMALDKKIADEILQLGQQDKVYSKILNEQRDILVSLPQGYDAAANIRYPVFYTLDGKTQFQHVVGTTKWLSQSTSKLPPHIVVAVINTKRFRDFSPSVPADQDNRYPDNPPGGADKFIRFIGEELIPYVDKNYRTSPLRTLAGHSFGGLLALQVMLTKPQLFQAYIAMSPNVKFDKMELVKRAAKQLKSRDTLAANLFISVGDEPDLSPGLAILNRALTQHAPKGLMWQSQVYLQEDHMSIPSKTLHNALMAIGYDFGWQLAPELIEQGFKAVKGHYQDLSQRFGIAFKPPLNTINRMGYELLAKQPAQAVAAFKYNAQTYPHDANLFDSLADGLEAVGQIKAAKAAMEQAIKLGTANQHRELAYFKQHLERLTKML